MIRQPHPVRAYGTNDYGMMGSNGDFGATVADDKGMKYYTCELECGFTLGGEGAFEKVALHEKTCEGTRVRRVR